MNTDNRLVAAAAKRRWENILQDFVYAQQRGFLPGRSILQNIVDVDDTAMRISLHTTSGAIVLFDFRAAFPSLSIDYMMTMLELIGVPRAARNLITALYFEQRC